MDDDPTIQFNDGVEGEPTEKPAAKPAISFGGTKRPERPESGSLIHSQIEYRVGEIIARGGMGQILEAVDTGLHRSVAMKVMLEESAMPDATERFVREAEVLARLEHPNIVPIHELGRDEHGRLFYTMKLVKGRTLQAIIAEIGAGQEPSSNTYTLDRLLTVFRKVCDAIAFAHHHGIIHRDLKPENIMVGEFGEVLVMDWGLAKILDGDDTTGADAPLADDIDDRGDSRSADSTSAMTMDGAVMGSPHYMPPEQAEGRVDDVGIHSDVYSLGGILYTILTLRPPIEGRRVGDVLSKVKSGNITPPVHRSRQADKEDGRTRSESVTAPQRAGQLPHCPRGRIPGVLSAVTMRAMAMQPSERYESVEALATDIEKYQRGYSTSVQQLSFIGQLLLLMGRNKALSVSLIAGTLLTGYLSIKLLSNWLVLHRMAGVEDRLYVNEMRQLAGLWRENRVEQFRGILKRNWDSPLIGWEWHYWRRQSRANRMRLSGHESDVSGVAVSPDGKLVATASRDHSVKIWAAANGNILRTLTGHRGPVHQVVFLPGSQAVVSASADGSARSWDLQTGKEMVSYAGHSGAVRSLAVSPEGKWLFTGGTDRSARIWNVESGESVHQLPESRSTISTGRFSPDGELLATGGRHDRVRIWEVATGRLRHVLRADPAQDLAFVENGKRMFTTHPSGWIRLWNVDDGQLTASWRSGGTADPQLYFDISDDETRVVTGSRRNIVVLRDKTRPGWPILGEFRGLAQPIQDLAIAADGSWAVAASGERDAVVLTLEAERPGHIRFEGQAGLVARLSPDGNRLITTCTDRITRIWDTTKEIELTRIAPTNGPAASDVIFAPDGNTVITVHGSRAHVWHADSGVLRESFTGHQKNINDLAISADGTRVATVAADTIRLWPPATGREFRSIKGDDRYVRSVAFMPDSKRLVSCGDATGTVVWNLEDGMKLFSLTNSTIARASSHRSVAVSPDGRMIATADASGLIELWDAQTGRRLGNVGGAQLDSGLVSYRGLTHRGQTGDLQFLGDSRRLASIGSDGFLRVWYLNRERNNVQYRGGEIVSFDLRGVVARSLHASQKGRRIVVAGHDPAAFKPWIKVWDRGPLSE